MKKRSILAWRRTIFIVAILITSLSLVLAACAPADLSGNAGNKKDAATNTPKHDNPTNAPKADNPTNPPKADNPTNTPKSNNNGSGGGVRGTNSGTPDPCLDAGQLPCGQGDHGKGNPINGSLHANCRAAQGEVDPNCTPSPTPTPGGPTETPGGPTDTPEPPTATPSGPTATPTATLPSPPIHEVKPAPVPGNSCPNWIVFHSFRTGPLNVYRLDGVEGAANAQLINLSKGPGIDSRPSRSPDDSFVVFQSDRNGNIELYMADNMGANQTRLTNSKSNNINAMVGPDNDTVIFQSDRNGNWDIFSLNIKTGTEHQLTSDSQDDINPFWSPDANWIVFQSNRSGTWNVYLLDLSTGNEYQVSNRPYDVIFPTWSPNGKQLAFFADWGGRWDLYVSNIDGGNVKRLTSTGNAGNVSWSPEGNRLAYQVGTDNNTDVFTYDLTNNKQYQLTTFAGADSGPSWDCGGSNVSFTSMSAGNPDIYSVPWNGGTISYITNDPATDKWSEWSPSKEDASQGY